MKITLAPPELGIYGMQIVFDNIEEMGQFGSLFNAANVATALNEAYGWKLSTTDGDNPCHRLLWALPAEQGADINPIELNARLIKLYLLYLSEAKA